MKRWRTAMLGVVISAACGVLLLRQVDLSKTTESFASAEPVWLLWALAGTAVALVLRCWRWQLLFLPESRVSLRGTMASTLVGYMLNTVLPGRVGELARASLLAQSDRVEVARAFGTIVVEKILDVLTLLLALGFLVTQFSLPREITAAGVLAAAGFTIVTGGFLFLCSRRAAVGRWSSRVLEPLPLLKRFGPTRLLDTLLGSAGGLGEPRLLAMQLALSAATWGTALVTAFVLLRAFHPGVSWAAAALVVVLTNLGMTIPSAPGYVGVYHAIAVLALGITGMDPSIALSFALVMHALSFGSFTIAGAIVLIAGLSNRMYDPSLLWPWRTPQSPSVTPTT